ncbi:hypothetical protein [Chryseobacterium wanjuense]
MTSLDYGGNTINWSQSYTDGLLAGVGVVGGAAINIPMIVLQGKGTKNTWNNSDNYGYNSYLMMSKITRALGEWNLQ